MGAVIKAEIALLPKDAQAIVNGCVHMEDITRWRVRYEERSAAERALDPGETALTFEQLQKWERP